MAGRGSPLALAGKVRNRLSIVIRSGYWTAARGLFLAFTPPSFPTRTDESAPPAGRLGIHSWFQPRRPDPFGPTSPHSWISYETFTPEGQRASYTTWGTFPSRLRALFRNRESVKRFALDTTFRTSRFTFISKAQEEVLLAILAHYASLGPAAWTLVHPCSTFAHHVWAAATGERIHTGIPSTPRGLKQAIRKANGGNSEGYLPSLFSGGTLGGFGKELFPTPGDWPLRVPQDPFPETG